MLVFAVMLLASGSLAANTAPPYDQPWCSEGKPCVTDDNCKQANGQNGHCCGAVCRKLPLARGELCGQSLSGSACPSCGNNLGCSGISGVFRCEAQKSPIGCLCNLTGATGDSGCLSGNCVPSGTCGAISVFTGGRCEESRQCLSNICNVTCQPLPSGAACTMTANFNLCGAGQVCISNRCTNISQLGDPCANDYECAQPDLYCAPGKQCSNRTARGQACTATSCMGSDVCSSGICTAFRSVAHNASCTVNEACISAICSGGACKPTHYLAAGASCTSDEQCPYFAACNAAKVCTASANGMRCNPTLGGSAMAAECLGSNDVYCECSGICLPVQNAILPTGNTTDECKAANDYISKFDALKDLTKVDVSGLTPEQKNAIATRSCCQDCGKDKRVSSEGFSVDCVTKTISTTQLNCDPFGADPLALTGCPATSTPASSGAVGVEPMLALVLFGAIVRFV